MLLVHLGHDLVDPPEVLVPVDESLDYSNCGLRLAPSHLLLGLQRLTVPRIGAKALDDSVDEQPADRELGGDLLGRSLVCVEGPVDLE